MSTTTQNSPGAFLAKTLPVNSSYFNESSKAWCVYKATSPTGKVYVGVTCREPVTRRAEHRYIARSGSDRHFANAMRKYGASLNWEALADNFDSMAAAARGSGLSVTQVRTALKSGRPTTQGFKFTRLEYGNTP